MTLILKALLFVVATLFSLAGVGLAFRSLRRLFTWCSAVGSVESIDECKYRGTLYRPTINFLTRDGYEITFGASATSWRKYRFGDSVRVLYDPRMPERAVIASFLELWFPVLVALCFAGIFFSASYTL